MVDELMPRENSRSNRGRILFQLWRFLELTRDIERNGEDTKFGRDGGQIDYVLDENVFEMLIDPVRNAHFVRLFHSYAMDIPVDQKQRDSISAQSALVTAEFLFHGRLPGQAEERPLYLTEWHYTELSIRFYELAGQAESHLRPARFSSDGTLQKTPDELTRKDVAEFLKKRKNIGTVESDHADRFCSVRTAARQMVEDQWGQVAIQLGQLGSESFTRRITPLKEPEEFRPNSKEEREIGRDAEQWMVRLVDERRLQGVSNFPERTSGALRNDARTLAHILWIARTRPSEKRRCVLVTGDRLIFDAYRRWYVDQPIWTPFLLRRVSQFAPIINFNDAESDVYSSAAVDPALGPNSLFIRTREAVEAAVIPFSLSQPNEDYERRRVVSRGREYLALALSQRSEGGNDPIVTEKAVEFFGPQLNDAWIAARRRDFLELQANWARVERFAIGVNHALVMGRWERGTKGDTLDALPDGAADRNESYTQYLQSVIRSLATGGIKLFFPLAVQYIRDVSQRRIEQAQFRVPLTVRLHLRTHAHGEGKAEDVGELIEHWVSGQEVTARLLDPANNKALAERPPLVFAVASALALRLGNWQEAERFSGIAAAGSEAMRAEAAGHHPKDEDDHYELLYLSAVAKRFRLGAQSPGKSGAVRNVWAELRSAAVDRLTQCAEYHWDRREFLLVSRAVSERAAVRLFYVAWAVLTPTEVAAERQLDFGDAEQELDAAIGDLHKCLFDLEEKTTPQLTEADRSRRDGHEQIKLQYVVNSAAAGALGRLLAAQRGSAPLGLPEPMMAALDRRLEAVETETQQLMFMHADVLAYRAFCRNDERARKLLLELVNTAPRQKLAVDQELLAGFGRLQVGNSSS